jgi:hypothetical protein
MRERNLVRSFGKVSESDMRRFDEVSESGEKL